MKKLLLSSFVLLYLCSCVTTTNVKNINNNDAPLAKIENDKLICLVEVKDGTYGSKVYPGSGSYVLNIFNVNLQPFASKIQTIDADNIEENAKQLGAKYIVKPTITNWEPRKASWSSRPTRVEMNVSVFDTEQNKNIINTNLSITGRTFTIVDQSAEGLASFLIKEFVQNITK